MLQLERHEIVVVVGPNNAGKSAALRDINQKLQSSEHAGVVVDQLTLQTEGSADEFASWADSLVKPGTVNVVFPFGAQNRGSVGTWWNRALNGQGLYNLKPLFAIFLSTEDRLTAANDVASINFTVDDPSAPLHHLYDREELEQGLSDMFKRAFGTDLVVNRGAGSHIVLHLGTRPLAPGGDRGTKSYRDAVSALPKIQTQGDGIRAFVGILLHTLIIDHDIILIDEPDAFLHPPQAATLGRLLATKIPKPRQLIAATHSSDFLRGVIDAPSSRVRVVRIRRSEEGNHVRELAPENLRELWRDPLLRFSNVLDGLFHDGVIVCEGDGDCRFYGAMMEAVSDDPKPDLLLTHSGGKARVPTIVKALRAIDVPVRAVLDFDVLRDSDELQAIYEALGGNWADIERDHRIVQAAVQTKRPELSTEDVRKRIATALEPIKAEVLPAETAKAISGAVKSASPWGEAKRVGKAFVPNGEATQAYERLVGQLRGSGLYLVEVGEVEQFCKSVPLHGPAWVIGALDRDLAIAPELEAARQFAQTLLNGW